MESNALLVLITCAGQDEARRIGTALVAERLAACVHIRAHEAIYRWEGRIEQQPEYTLLAKTIRDRFSALETRVLAMHSYTLPGIIAVPVETGSAAFLAWVVAETGAAPW